MPTLEPPQNFILLFLFQIGSMNGNVTSSSHQTPTMDSLFEPFSKANLWISTPQKRKQNNMCNKKIAKMFIALNFHELNPWWVGVYQD
jgi:hypothetical protein